MYDVYLSSLLEMALARRNPPKGLLHHSDRGVHYASIDYQALLAKHNCVCSMSRKGNCWDTAVGEHFFVTLERERIEGSDWHSHQEVRQALFDYLEVYSNSKRRHSGLGYKSPADYEAERTLSQTAA